MWIYYSRFHSHINAMTRPYPPKAGPSEYSSSDHTFLQFLLHLDEKFTLGSKFIIQDLDDTHLFISPDVLDQLKGQIDDLMDKISVPIVEGVAKS